MTDDAPQAPPRRYLTTREAADYLRLKKNSLEKMRWQGRGPRFRHHGRNVVYAVEDLDAWSDRHTACSTSQAGGKGGDGSPDDDGGVSEDSPAAVGPDAGRCSDG